MKKMLLFLGIENDILFLLLLIAIFLLAVRDIAQCLYQRFRAELCRLLIFFRLSRAPE